MPVALSTFVVFTAAALAEIAGCFAFWAWLRQGRSILWLAPGVLSLVLFAWLLTLAPSQHAGRAYAAYGGIYIVASLLWLWMAEGQRPDSMGSRRWPGCDPGGGDHPVRTQRLVAKLKGVGTVERPPEPAGRVSADFRIGSPAAADMTPSGGTLDTAVASFGGNAVGRRELLKSALAGALAMLVPARVKADQAPFKFGLTPVFLVNDLELLGHLRTYLASRIGRPVELVTRRTYQEITALLVSGQIQSAWICGYPYVQYKADLDLVATPVWHGKPLYQSYLIAAAGRTVEDWTGLRGDVHAFSDPDSNSGFLVTRALLAENRLLAGRLSSREPSSPMAIAM